MDSGVPGADTGSAARPSAGDSQAEGRRPRRAKGPREGDRLVSIGQHTRRAGDKASRDVSGDERTVVGGRDGEDRRGGGAGGIRDDTSEGVGRTSRPSTGLAADDAGGSRRHRGAARRRIALSHVAAGGKGGRGGGRREAVDDDRRRPRHRPGCRGSLDHGSATDRSHARFFLFVRHDKTFQTHDRLVEASNVANQYVARGDLDRANPPGLRWQSPERLGQMVDELLFVLSP